MSKKLLKYNAPENLIPLAEKWASEGKSFYLGPDSIFKYNDKKLVYAGGKDISTDEGSWYICTEDNIVPVRPLYREEIEQIQNAIAVDHKPQRVQVFIDYKCNLECHMCKQHGDNDDFYNKYLMPSDEKTLTYDEVKILIDKILEENTQDLLVLSRGEILLHKDWKKIYSYLVSKGMGISFITNGTLLTEKVIKELIDIAKKPENIRITVSLHASDFETWSAVTGSHNKNLYETAANSPLLLKKYGIKTSIVFVKTEKNIHNLKNFIERYIDNSDELTLTDVIINNDIRKLDYEPIACDPLGLCQHSRNKLYIDHGGRVAPCCWLSTRVFPDPRNNMPDWNINNQSLDNIITEIRAAWKTDIFRKFCETCPDRLMNFDRIKTSVHGYKATKKCLHTFISKEHNKM